MMRAGRPVVCSLLALMLCLAGAAAADEKDQATADTLFKQGRAAADRRDHATACARFHESDRLDPALGTKFNIADCEEHLGNLETAWALFAEVAAKFPAGDDRLPIAKRRLAGLEKRLAKIVVRLAAEAQGAAVERDGQPMDESLLGAAVPVRPGHHKIVVTAPGRAPRGYDLDAKAGDMVDLTVTIGASTPAPNTAAAVKVEPPQPEGTGSAPVRRTLGFVAVGLGIAGIGVGAITGGLALADKRKVDASCHGTKFCVDQAGIDASAQGRVVSIVSTASFAIGGAALLAGVVLVLTSKDPPKTMIAPSASPAGAGLVFRRSF